MNRLSKRLRGDVRRLFRWAGYDVGSIAKRQQEAARLRNKHLRWVETLGIETLVDIGANEGQFAQLFSDVRPGCPIYSFEPLRDCFETLQRNMTGVPGFKAFNVALGETEGETCFFRSEFSASSSLLPMGALHKGLFPSSSSIVPETVTVRRLDSYASEIQIRGGLLVKIDVQGAEMRVLDGGRRLIGAADAVLLEAGFLSLYEGQATIEEILVLLSGLNFCFMGILNQYLRPRDSLPVYGDVLFVKRDALEHCGDSLVSGAILPRLRGRG
jgi:FkbM family methyltransferase